MINLKDIFKSYNIDLSEKQYQQFQNYYNLLIKYNENINLTAITDYDDVVIKHFLDSVLPAKNINKNAYIIDIGTGAGFPAIPLKIIRPDLKFVLVDSLNKRINFLNIIINELELNEIIAIHSRSEDLAHNSQYREKFDYCVSRAVAKLNTLCELCIPFVKTEGSLLAYKGSNFQEEINISKNCLKILNCDVNLVKNYILPLNFGERNIIQIKKRKSTLSKYPRKNNLPKNKPL